MIVRFHLSTLFPPHLGHSTEKEFAFHTQPSRVRIFAPLGQWMAMMRSNTKKVWLVIQISFDKIFRLEIELNYSTKNSKFVEFDLLRFHC